MRALAFLLFVAVSAAACAENKPADDRRVVSDEEFVRSFIWSRVPADGWASSPTLVIARRDGLYPAAPDVEVALACLPDGSVSVSGNAYSVGTDVGGPPDVVPRFSLQSDVVSLSGEPIWEHGSFSKHAHFILWLTPDQLSELIRGDWFEVGSIFADGSGTVRYPPHRERSLSRSYKTAMTHGESADHPLRTLKTIRHYQNSCGRLGMFDLLLIDLTALFIGLVWGLLTRWPRWKTLIVTGLIGAVPAAAYAVISFPDAAAVPREFFGLSGHGGRLGVGLWPGRSIDRHWTALVTALVRLRSAGVMSALTTLGRQSAPDRGRVKTR